MKNQIVGFFLLLAGGAGSSAQSATALPIANAASNLAPFPPTTRQIVERGSNHRVWQWQTYEAGPGGKVLTRNHQYTELGTGLCYQQNGQWLDASEEISILADGSAAATQGASQVYFPADISQGVINVVTPDGKQLQSQPVGLAYDDGTNTVMFATLTNSVGQLLVTNQAMYPNAFTGVNADLLYTYKLGGFEQFVVLRDQIPTPASLGLSPSARLQVWTEFFNPPTPAQEDADEDSTTGLTDAALNFGSVRFGRGRAFMIGEESPTNRVNPSSQIRVYKNWINVQGRTFLIESVPYQRVRQQFQSLPLSSSIAHPKEPSCYAWQRKNNPHLPLAHNNGSNMKSQFVRGEPTNKNGYVLDYVQVNAGQTNYTFKADTTYYVTATCNLSGVTTFEGGTVIKCLSGQLNISGTNSTVNCQTSPYRPAIFTSANDNSVGEFIGNGNPAATDVMLYLQLDPNNLIMHDLRLSYAQQGMSQSFASIGVTNGMLDVWNCQLNQIGVAFYVTNLKLHNVLINSGGSGSSHLESIGLTGPSLSAENITANIPNTAGLVANFYFGLGSAAYTFTNCLITGEPIVSSLGPAVTPITNSTVVIPIPTSPVYQIVGGSSFYLTNNSPYRGYGTTNISPVLLAQFKGKTTYPPLVLADGTVISTNAFWNPVTPRDTNSVLDIGYHYDAVDYVVADAVVSNNIALSLTPGTVLGWYHGTANGSGLAITNGATFASAGAPNNPCIITPATLVQEGNSNWTNNVSAAGVALSASNDAGNTPTSSSIFTKWFGIHGSANLFQDNNSNGVAYFKSSELYAANLSSTESSQYYTNCLFFRTFCAYNLFGVSYVYANCTFYNGGLESVASGIFENTVFDGTALWVIAPFHGSNQNSATNLSNAYNGNNFSWTNYSAFSPTYQTIYSSGPIINDLVVTNFNWQSSWFGNFYLPPNSPLIDAGAGFADEYGLYEYTTQTNQAKELGTLDDIGYHYVATDTFGNPLSTYVSGVPDYLADSSGNGILDSWQSLYYGIIGVDPNAIANGSGMTFLQAYKLGLNPTIDPSATAGSRANYIYDAGGWLNSVSGTRNGTITPDNEGNTTQTSQ